MDFDSLEWDENKRLRNIEKHGLDFWDAFDVLDGPCLHLPARVVRGEVRSLALGMLDEVHVCIIYTMRGTVLRVISMRKARWYERQHYHEVFGN
jgi:uncharacterized protein